MTIYLYIYDYLSVYLSIICLSICLLSVVHSVFCLFAVVHSLPLVLSVCPLFNLSIYLSIYLSIVGCVCLMEWWMCVRQISAAEQIIMFPGEDEHMCSWRSLEINF